MQLKMASRNPSNIRKPSATTPFYEPGELRYTVTNCSLSPLSERRETLNTLEFSPEKPKEQLFTDPALLSMIRKDLHEINRNRLPDGPSTIH